MNLLGISVKDLQNPQVASAWGVKALAIILTLATGVVVSFWIGEGQIRMLILFMVVAFIAFVTTVTQRRAWVLIPLAWSLTGSIPILGLPFSPRHLAVMLTACAYVGYRVLSKADVRRKFTGLDAIVWLNLGWFFVTFIIHPAGFSSLGTGTVGGRAYFEAVVTAVAYWLVVRMPESVKTVSRLPYLMLVSAVLVTIINVVGYIFPAALPRLYMFYTSFDWDVYFSDSTRLKGLAEFGIGIIPVLCAFYRPRILFNPLRPQFYLFLLGLVCILASGFRNMLLAAMATVIISALFHRGWRELVVAGMMGSVLLVGLAVGQGRFYSLPLGVQRTLSFLPGNWSASAVADAEASTRWRFELWKRIIRENEIKNWWVGDGMGISLEDINAIQRGASGDAFTENTLITGYYHNGPLTALRYAGMIGLVLFYFLMIAAAVAAARCVERCRGTPFFPAAIYLAVLLIWFPVHFTFVFGSFNGDITEVVFLVGLLRLVSWMRERIRVPDHLQPLPETLARGGAAARASG